MKQYQQPETMCLKVMNQTILCASGAKPNGASLGNVTKTIGSWD